MLQGEGIAPSYKDYPDRGCRLHPHCLTCPFPTCLIEELGTAMSHYERRYVEYKRERNEAIRACRQDGLKPAEIATTYGISRTRVYQILKIQ